MEIDFLAPLSQDLLDQIKNLDQHSLGAKTLFHSERSGLPDLENVHVAIFGVKDNRRAVRKSETPEFSQLRRNFYRLFPGNWRVNIADLGDVEAGATVDDTYFAVQQIVESLIKKDILPVILGGSQDLIYAQYRAYDKLDQMVNLVNIDSKFDLGDADKAITSESYVGKIVVDQPYNLFNYSALGYQTYFNSQEEIELMERLFF